MRALRDGRRAAGAARVVVDPAGEGVDLRLEDVGDDGEAAAHVAVERAIADGDLALVAGGEQQRAEFVGQRHHEHAAHARLDVLLGDVARPSGEDRAQHRSRRRPPPRRWRSCGTRCPGSAASWRASSLLCPLEIAEGRLTPVTFSGPKAAAASTPTTAESMPPLRATRPCLKPLLLRIVAQAEHQRVENILHFRLVRRTRRSAGPSSGRDVRQADVDDPQFLLKGRAGPRRPGPRPMPRANGRRKSIRRCRRPRCSRRPGSRGLSRRPVTSVSRTSPLP